MNKKLTETIQWAKSLRIDESRLPVLHQVIDYVQQKIDTDKPVQLNFICTHNSRRSQLSQIWAKTVAVYHQIPLESYSGGVEVTAFNERAVESCKRLGFEVEVKVGGENPHYQISVDAENSITLFSKVFDDPVNPATNFAAVMTCSDADENCPFIPGAEARIPLRYEDPKAFDYSAQEAEKYDERNLQIASEMCYIFGKINGY